MTQIATVERIINSNYAEVSVPRQSACGHDCSECAGCGVTGSVVYAQARNPIGAEPGQQVVIESSTKKMIGIVSLVYLVPIILFLLGYGLGVVLHMAAMRYVVAGCGFVIGMIPALFYDRKIRRHGGFQFTIVRLF